MKNLGKRLAALGLTGEMAMSLAACGGSTESTATADSTSTAASTTSSGETPTITLYPKDANLTSGVIGGRIALVFSSE